MLPQTPAVDPATVQTGTQAINQQGLTPSEQALLEEEKAIRLRQRGLA